MKGPFVLSHPLPGSWVSCDSILIKYAMAGADKMLWPSAPGLGRRVTCGPVSGPHPCRKWEAGGGTGACGGHSCELVHSGLMLSAEEVTL